MQFITNGPEIPETLLRAHEENHVIFFCGAGISYPAGLRGFRELVDKIYIEIGVHKEANEQVSYTAEQFDNTLHLLTHRLPGNGLEMRKTLHKILHPQIENRGATDTHRVLIQLARNKENRLRLITTNFDRIFEHVIKEIIKETGQIINTFKAPLLPIPKNSHWDGLVYLHGLLPEDSDDNGLEKLVLTSGDFGLAYLIERWAARFISELFRRYTICFVGYSVNDVILRYVMDALAADQMRGEALPKAYAFGSYESGKEQEETTKWQAKGVIPILYNQSNNHIALHETLKIWANSWSDGIIGKRRIINDHARTHPSESTKQDNFVGRVIWALSDKSGLPAKDFANLNPVPVFDWFDHINKYRYGYNDLPTFEVTPNKKVDDKLEFSLINRPSSYQFSTWMALIPSNVNSNNEWDNVMWHLANWLVRHLNDPRLILWLVRHGKPRRHLSSLIQGKLDEFSEFERKGEMKKLEEIRINAPNSIPCAPMRTLWQLLLNDQVKSPKTDVQESYKIYNWDLRLKHEGITFSLRLELRKLLSPKLALRESFKFETANTIEAIKTQAQLKQHLDWELVLAADDVYSALRDRTNQHWQNALPVLLDDFQQLLHDSLNLLQELGDADEYNDGSYIDLPSISPHPQNTEYQDWIILIELLRDAWLAIKNQNLRLATHIAKSWFDKPYPVFKRLALFAASQDSCIAPEQWLDWLLTDNAWWLWTNETQRETMCLLSLQGKNLTPPSQKRLEEAILAGPPRNMYRLEIDNWDYVVEIEIKRLLKKLVASGIILGPDASERWSALSATDNTVELKDENDEIDEFPYWMTSVKPHEFPIEKIPRTRHKIIEWLENKIKEESEKNSLRNNWSFICRTRFYHSLYALCDLSKKGLWPSEFWREALQVWSEEELISKSWKFGAPLIKDMPEEVLKQILNMAAYWLHRVSRCIDVHDSHDDILLKLCERILTFERTVDTDTSKIPKQADDDKEPITAAINHSVGFIAIALTNMWLKPKPNDNEGLPSNIRSLFNQICNIQEKKFRHGRVILASYVVSLFRVDRQWCEKNILPLFDWENSQEAKAAWMSFIRSGRLYQPLMIVIKSQFLKTVENYEMLGNFRDGFIRLLTYAALEQNDGYTTEDFYEAFKRLPQEGLLQTIKTLSSALKAAGNKRENYWKNRIQPFWQKIWPKSFDKSQNMIEALVELSIATGEEFPSALETVYSWLQPIENLYHIVQQLNKSNLCSQFPNEVVKLIYKIIDNSSTRTLPSELEHSLSSIIQAKSQLKQDHRYKWLMELIEMRSYR